MLYVPKGRVDSNGDMVHIYARNEGSEKSAHCTVNRFRFSLPYGFCIFQGALNWKMYQIVKKNHSWDINNQNLEQMLMQLDKSERLKHK